MQRRHFLEDTDIVAEDIEPFLDRPVPGQIGEFLLEDRLVGGLELGIPVKEFDDVIALVHAVLDQRVAGQRANHMDAVLGRLESRRQRGEGIGRGAGKAHADRLDKTARRFRAGAGDDAVAPNHLLAIARVQQQLSRPHFLGRSLAPDGDTPVGFGLLQQFDIGALCTGKAVTAVEDRHHIALRRIGSEAEGILHPGIARTDHGDMFVEILARIVQLVLDMWHIGARDTQQVWIALRADGKHDILRPYRVLARDFDGEIALLSGDRSDFRLIQDIDLLLGNLAIPDGEDSLPAPRIEIEVCAQHQIAGRRHDVLALLVLENRIGKVVRLFDQDMAEAEMGSMRGGAQPGRTRTDDCHFDLLRNLHHSVPPNSPMPYSTCIENRPKRCLCDADTAMCK